MDPSLLQITELSGPFPQSAANLENRFGLINAETVHISPETAGRWQKGELQKTTNHGVQTNIDKMPQAIETDKEQHQGPNNYPVVPRLGFSGRLLVDTIEYFFEPEQIQKLDQSQKTSKATEPLCANVIKRRRDDSAVGRGFFAKDFITGAILHDSLRLSFNHLGYLLFYGMSLVVINPSTSGGGPG
jgi:hypothetical protein